MYTARIIRGRKAGKCGLSEWIWFLGKGNWERESGKGIGIEDCERGMDLFSEMEHWEREMDLFSKMEHWVSVT